MNIEERIERLEKAVQAITELPVMTNLAQKDPRTFKNRAINLAIEKSAELESLPTDEQEEAKKLILKCVCSAAPALSLEHCGNS